MVGDRTLPLRAARTQRFRRRPPRCFGGQGAVEGKLAFGPTKHGGTIAGGELWGRLGVCLLFCRAVLHNSGDFGKQRGKWWDGVGVERLKKGSLRRS